MQRPRERGSVECQSLHCGRFRREGRRWPPARAESVDCH
ncbi:hypothetical protein CZ674_08490 [Agrococcus casei LMG 22410]|uniref:Uncharacterized protein n=1 Tax=Agrococcus casei LMG 22410 TaxID=1255656 RepID=A0A1R4G3C1_9MICO|nr:hypothetical protein CZ674_08490 [Agrococcus casei LMG 22410]